MMYHPCDVCVIDNKKNVPVCDIDGNNNKNNQDDNTKHTNNCIDTSSITNDVNDIDEDNNIPFDDSIDDNATSNISVYFPVKNNYNAINQHDLNEENLILVDATNGMKVTSGNDNSHTKFVIY